VRQWKDAFLAAQAAELHALAAGSAAPPRPPKRAKGGGEDAWGSAASAEALAQRSAALSWDGAETPYGALLFGEAPPAAQNYSLWLRFEPAADAALQRLVDDLAARHGAIPFAPHITVVPAFGLTPATRDGALRALRKLAMETPAPRVFSEGAEAGANAAHWRWRCVYARCRCDAALVGLEASARAALGLPPNTERYFPHASVVYSDCGAEARAAMRDAAAGQLAAAFEGGVLGIALELWETTTEGSWRREDTFQFGGARET
jgi:2'-5' RNA ligase